MYRITMLILSFIFVLSLCACEGTQSSVAQSTTTTQSDVPTTTESAVTEVTYPPDEQGISVPNYKVRLCLDEKMYNVAIICPLSYFSDENFPVTYGYFDGDVYIHSEEIFTEWNDYLGDAKLVLIPKYPYENMQVSVEDKIQRVALYKYEDKGYLGVAYYYNSLGMEYTKCYLWHDTDSQDMEEWLEVMREKVYIPGLLD